MYHIGVLRAYICIQTAELLFPAIQPVAWRLGVGVTRMDMNAGLELLTMAPRPCQLRHEANGFPEPRLAWR